MQILFLTNFYPPFSLGGYEQWCQEVAEGLRTRGHDVLVLTSRHRGEQADSQDPDWVVRKLHLEMELTSFSNALKFFTSRAAHEDDNLNRLKQEVTEFSPEILLIWGMWNLPRSLPAMAETLMKDRVVYYLGDYWPTLPSQFVHYWKAPAHHWSSAVPKRILRMMADRTLSSEPPPVLEFANVMFPTRFMQHEFARRGIVPRHGKVVFGGADTAPYLSTARTLEWDRTSSPHLLYVGRLEHAKGVHTAIGAMALLVHKYSHLGATLTVVGGGDPDYLANLHKLVKRENLDECVTFLGVQPKEKMPEIYCQADVLLFPSLWQEPFGRVIVEAMASGLVVVGTATGGAGELLMDEENALAFPPGDAAELAGQVRRLIRSPALRSELSRSGRQQAVERFDIGHMTTGIEAYLDSVVKQT